MFVRAQLRSTGQPLRRSSPASSSGSRPMATSGMAQTATAGLLKWEAKAEGPTSPTETASPKRPRTSELVEQVLRWPVEPLRPEEKGDRAGLLRRRRALRREAAHGEERDALEAGVLSFLEINSVRAGTSGLYGKVLRDFYDWLKDEDAQVMSVAELDGLLVEYLEHLYFTGRNVDAGEKAVAALRCASPALVAAGPGALARAGRYLRGFRRLAPGASRAPIPLVGRAAMVGASFFTNEAKFGTALMVPYIGYLRPHELLSMTGNGLIPPTASQPNVWGILLAPESEGVRSKTQQFDESVTIDWVHLPALGRRLHALKRSAGRREELWGLGHRAFSLTFARMAEISGVASLRPHPYSVRHAGASDDYLTGRRTLEQVRIRGRWKSDKSVRRYLKASRAMQQEHDLPTNTLRYGQEVLKHFDAVFAGRWKPPAPPCFQRLTRAAERRVSRRR